MGRDTPSGRLDRRNLLKSTGVAAAIGLAGVVATPAVTVATAAAVARQPNRAPPTARSPT